MKVCHQWSLPKQVMLIIALSTIFSFINFAHTPMAMYLSQYGIFSVFSVLIILKTIGGPRFFYHRLSDKRINLLNLLSCLSFLFIMLICKTPISFWYALHSKDSLLIAATAVTAGVFEESFFRGLLFSVIIRSSRKSYRHFTLTYSAILSSLLFGLYHFINFTGDNLVPVMVQVGYAFSFGLFFCFSKIAFNTLLVPIILHVYIDLQATTLNSVTTSINWLIGLLIFLPLIMSTIIYLLAVDKHLKSTYVTVS